MDTHRHEDGQYDSTQDAREDDPLRPSEQTDEVLETMGRLGHDAEDGDQDRAPRNEDRACRSEINHGQFGLGHDRR